MEEFFKGISNIFDSVIISSQLQSGGKIIAALKITANDTELDIVNALYKLFIPIALYMVLIYGLMELVDILSKDNATFEQILKFFIKIGVCIVFVQAGAGIIGGICSYGNYLIDTVGTGWATGAATSGTSEIGGAVADMFSNQGFLKGMFLFLMVFITGLIGKIAGAVILVMLYARKVEMLLRLGFSSIAFANVYGELNRSEAVRYLKKLLALSLQGVGIAGALAIIGAIQNDQISHVISDLNNANAKLGDLLGAQIELLVYMFVAIGVISTVRTILNDAIVGHP